MSRIGKQPVVIPSGVSVKFDGNVVTAKGPKGELTEPLHPYVKAEIKDGKVPSRPTSPSRPKPPPSGA